MMLLTAEDAGNLGVGRIVRGKPRRIEKERMAGSGDSILPSFYSSNSTVLFGFNAFGERVFSC